jgi:predicted DNA-binding transcriptional regulator AlpA
VVQMTDVLDEPLLNPQQAAPELKVLAATLAAWRNRGQGPRYVKIGKLIFYRPSDLREWVKSRVTEPVLRPTRRAVSGVS